MRVAYYAGWGLFIAAFILAAAEVLVRSSHKNPQVIVAAHDLLYTIWPSGLLILQIRLENINPYLWDPWVLTILAIPAWALLGVPGFLCVSLFRPKRPNYHKRLEEARRYEKQLLLYDELAKEAALKGIDQEENDMRPDHSVHDIFLGVDRNDIDVADDFYKFFDYHTDERNQEKRGSMKEPQLKKTPDESPSD